MMLRNDLREPDAIEQVSDASLPEAVARAIAAAADPGPASADSAWTFYVVESEAASSLAWLAARRLESQVGTDGARAAYEQWRAVPGWVVVTCRRTSDTESFERDREAALTAAQRLSLSLWSENVPCKWDPELASDEQAFFDLIGADSEHEVPVGVLLYGHPDRRKAEDEEDD